MQDHSVLVEIGVEPKKIMKFVQVLPLSTDPDCLVSRGTRTQVSVCPAVAVAAGKRLQAFSWVIQNQSGLLVSL